MEMQHVMPGKERHNKCCANNGDDKMDRGVIAEIVAAAETNPFIVQIDHLANVHPRLAAKKDVEKDTRICLLPVFTLRLYPNNIGESVSESVGLFKLHVQKPCEHTTVLSIACSHVQLWYIVVYDCLKVY